MWRPRVPPFRRDGAEPSAATTASLAQREQVVVMDHYPEAPRNPLRPAALRVRRRRTVQVWPLFYGRAEPAGEPLGGQTGIAGSEPPRARTDHSGDTAPGEGVNRHVDRARAEQPPLTDR